jgi:hypothetical protein
MQKRDRENLWMQPHGVSSLFSLKRVALTESGALVADNSAISVDCRGKPAAVLYFRMIW